jgi:hypothetical protein
MRDLQAEHFNYCSRPTRRSENSLLALQPGRDERERMIEKEWLDFCRKCFGNISHQQYIDLRRTFYGGAAALYGLQMRLLDPSAGDEPTEQDLQMMRGLRTELDHFNEEVKAGRA